MMNIDRLKIFFVCSFLAVSGYAKQQSHPNILWIIAEDMSCDLRCYGNTLVKTPTIDELGHEGMKFTQMFTTAAMCSPSRTALATGMYQTSIDAMHMRYPENLKKSLPDGMNTIAYLLQANGYQTLNLAEEGTTYHGKDDYMFKLDEPSFEYTSLDQLDGSKPFFAKVCSFYTHRDFKNDLEDPIDPGKVKLAPYYPEVGPLLGDHAAYLENIQLFDKETAQLLKDMEQRGLLENTIIFLFSDHGSPMMRGKAWLYDSGLNVPFIVYIPNEMEKPKGYVPGGTDNALHSLIDLSATTLELAGVPKPGYMQGHVFLGENQDPERTYVFASIDRIGGIYFKTRAVRSKKYKYIKNFHNGWTVLECSTEYRKVKLPHYYVFTILDLYNKLNEAQKTIVTPLPLDELYDLENDPYEIHNLAHDDSYQQVKKAMEEVLTAWINDIDDKGMYPDPPEIQKHFIDYRTENKERLSDQRLKSYLKIEKQLRAEGVIN